MRVQFSSVAVHSAVGFGAGKICFWLYKPGHLQFSVPLHSVYFQHSFSLFPGAHLENLFSRF